MIMEECGSKTAKEFGMKSLVKVFGIIALIAVIGFAFAGCSNGTGGSGGGNKIPAELVAKWYSTQELADEEYSGGYLQVMSDGMFFVSFYEGDEWDGEDTLMYYKVNGNTMTLYNGGFEQGSVTFEIEGTKLTTGEGDNAGFHGNGEYYKKAE
jgi:hypothetical protein